MHPTVKRWLQSVEQAIEAAVETTIDELAIESERTLYREIPSERTKTKRSVRRVKTGRMSQEVGFYFSARYNGSTNTRTHQILKAAWRDKIRPAMKKQMVKKLNAKLQR